MRFEDILPNLRQGGKAGCFTLSNSGYVYIFLEGDNFSLMTKDGDKYYLFDALTQVELSNIILNAKWYICFPMVEISTEELNKLYSNIVSECSSDENFNMPIEYKKL